MLPWLITTTTDLTPDQVLLKLRDMTGTEYKTPFRIFGNTDYAATLTKSFAGNVDIDSDAFRLVRDPHRVFNRQGYKRWPFRTVYQGSVKNQDGKSIIAILVRPSIWGFSYFVLLLWISYNWVVMTQGNIAVALLLLIPLWSIPVLFTCMEVRKAREMFERLFPDVERPVKVKERPLKLSRRKW
jgi:hypothetical protein